MREIKFRVWDAEWKRMVYPIGIDWENQHTKGQTTVYYWNLFKDGSKRGTPCQKQYSSIEQFTGLRDRNGVEIYEGDILRSFPSQMTGPVVWANGSFVMSINNYRYRDCTATIDDKQEVIGNIHQNPELLK